MEKSQNLIALVSLFNLSDTGIIYISKADYYNTKVGIDTPLLRKANLSKTIGNR